MESFLEDISFLKLCSLVLASLCYSHFIVSKLPIGKFRLFSLLPIFTLFTILPLSLSSSVLSAGITAFFFTWLSNFKLLLFSFNHGPLSNNLSLLNFILIAAFPIKINHPFPQSQNPTKLFLLNFWSKILITSIIVAILHNYGEKLHPYIVFVIYCCMLYLAIDIIMGICNKLVGSIMGGVDLCPPSDEPYLATSLQDFWGHRWNLVVTDALRHTVYKPMRAFLSFYMGQRWAHVLAVMAAFSVSGVMHELIFYYMTRVSPSWEVTWFFVLHGLCVVLEVALKRALGPKLGLHWAVSGPLAVGFVMSTAKWLFFPPIVRNRVDVRAIEEIIIVYDFIKGSFIK